MVNLFDRLTAPAATPKPQPANRPGRGNRSILKFGMRGEKPAPAQQPKNFSPHLDAQRCCAFIANHRTKNPPTSALRDRRSTHATNHNAALESHTNGMDQKSAEQLDQRVFACKNCIKMAHS
ncbi:MAG: hypothetical protein ABI145_03990 [Steroidobacteraceae bacterium]